MNDSATFSKAHVQRIENVERSVKVIGHYVNRQ